MSQSPLPSDDGAPVTRSDSPASTRRGPVPDRRTVDWEAACRALHHAACRVPVEQHDRSPEQQASVERFTTRMVQISELLTGPELGMMGLPVIDECSGREFFVPDRKQAGWPVSLSQEKLNEGRERGLWWALRHPRHVALAWAVFEGAGRWWWWFRQ